MGNRVKFQGGDLWNRDRAWRAVVKLAETHQKLCAQSIVDENTRGTKKPDLGARENGRLRQS
jgi:hypothetical protein